MTDTTTTITVLLSDRSCVTLSATRWTRNHDHGQVMIYDDGEDDPVGEFDDAIVDGMFRTAFHHDSPTID